MPFLQTDCVSVDLSSDKPTSKLSLRNVKPEDTGTYVCESKSADSKTTCTTLCHIHVFGRFKV